MEAFVDPTLCIGCGQCADVCPEVFHLEDTIAHALEGPLSIAYGPQVIQAEQGCPVGAITVQQ